MTDEQKYLIRRYGNMTDEQKRLYDLYIETRQMGKKLFASLKPTADEIRSVYEDLINARVEDFLCDPDKPTDGDDLGLIACWLYENREMREYIAR